ncbi:hypothetical protein [Kamptonema formosum]|uniref:hypothetical protein n=1 Tax=Kamptonema formosum TaxID=331992 RepID=UPI0003457187|nr:hypothetical protein [Oscillatoria sp. PCC 10802]
MKEENCSIPEFSIPFSGHLKSKMAIEGGWGVGECAAGFQHNPQGWQGLACGAGRQPDALVQLQIVVLDSIESRNNCGAIPMLAQVEAIGWRAGGAGITGSRRPQTRQPLSGGSAIRTRQVKIL